MIAALLLAASTVAHAVLAAPAPIDTPVAAPATLPRGQQASHADALRFARLYVPSEQTIAVAQAQFARSFEQGFASDPSSAQAERSLPGLKAAVLAGGQAELSAILTRDLPGIQDRVATLVEAYLTPDQMRQVIAFYQDGSVARMQAAVGDADFGAMGKRIQADPDHARITSGDLIGAAGPAALAAMSKADIDRMAAFMATTAGVRFRQVMPILLATVADESTRLMKANAVEIQTATLTAARDFAAGHRQGDRK